MTWRELWLNPDPSELLCEWLLELRLFSVICSVFPLVPAVEESEEEQAFVH